MQECQLCQPKAQHILSGKKSRWLSQTGSTGANKFRFNVICPLWKEDGSRIMHFHIFVSD